MTPRSSASAIKPSLNLSLRTHRVMSFRSNLARCGADRFSSDLANSFSPRFHSPHEYNIQLSIVEALDEFCHNRTIHS